MKPETAKSAEKAAEQTESKAPGPQAASKPGSEAKPQSASDIKPSEPAAKAAESAARAAKSAEKPKAERSAASPVPLIAAAVLGGVVSLAGAAALDLFGGAETVSDDRIAALESELAATRSAAESLRGDLEQQISALKTGAGDSEAAGAIQARIDALQAEIAKIPSASGSAPDLAPLEARLAELESLIGSGGSGREVALEALEARVSKLGETLQARGSAADLVKPLDERLNALASELEGRIAAIDRKADEAARQAAAAASKAEEADARAAAAASSDAISDAVETSSMAARKAEQAVAIAPVLAAESLQSAVEAGEPFATALAAFQSLGIDDPALETLKPYADQGLPTIPALRAEFAALEQGFASKPAPEATDEDEGMVNRLLKSALDVVEVHPVEPQAGDDALSIGSRIKGALADRDLKTALAEWQNLPEARQAATMAWADKLRAIIAAETLADTVRTSALARLNTIQ